MDNTMVKALLWMLLAAAVAANGFLSSEVDGVFQVVLSVVAGAVGLAATAGLVAMKRSAS
ncbi:hypothetical protein ACH4SP_40340 [Streptomyces sp. NPDC021093]|uniref:hypothetical protein n=1 Tax=Streptomyces sp. NPDC021093 TaxID=3365112 RepID=UPI0037AD310E